MDRVKEAELLAERIRRSVVQMIGCSGQTGHIGGSFSSADLVAALYGSKLRHDPKDPHWSERDKFLYSKGHAAVAQYAALALTGYFAEDELLSIKRLGSRLQGHPDRLKTPGIEAGTGSLGQGLSIANGLALAMRLDKSPGTVYCLMGDGELAEGQIWEAAMAAGHYKLGNIVGILDHNKLQATGPIAERMDSSPIPDKWRAFGWVVSEIDGHNIEEIFNALDAADSVRDRPVIIIAHTVKGKGASFAENIAGFHNSALTPEQYDMVLSEIDARIAALISAEGGRVK